MMGIKENFLNDFETNEDSSDPQLKTHYYKARVDDVESEVVYMIEKIEQGKIINIDVDRKEVFFYGKNYEAIITLSEQRFYQTSIDIKVHTNMVFPRKKGKKVILGLYEYLNKKLDFVGTSLFDRIK